MGGNRSNRVSVAVKPTPNALSERELEVMRLVAVGKSNREIGYALEISERTAQAHIGNILQKLHARSRLEAVAALGWIQIPAEDKQQTLDDLRQWWADGAKHIEKVLG